MNKDTPATVTIDANVGIVAAFADGPHGRATRVKLWADKAAFSANEPSLVDIDFGSVRAVVEWFGMNTTTIGRIHSLIKAKDAGNN